MSCLTVSLHDVETGNLSLKGSCHIGIRPVLYDAAVEVLYRTHELSLFQCTVTDDYSGVKQLVVRLKSIVHNSFGSDLGFHALVTDNGANQNIFCLCFDGVMSVDTPLVVPLTITVAPTRSSFVAASFTVPVTVTFWAKSSNEATMAIWTEITANSILFK